MIHNTSSFDPILSILFECFDVHPKLVATVFRWTNLTFTPEDFDLIVQTAQNDSITLTTLLTTSLDDPLIKSRHNQQIVILDDDNEEDSPNSHPDAHIQLLSQQPSLAAPRSTYQCNRCLDPLGDAFYRCVVCLDFDLDVKCYSRSLTDGTNQKRAIGPRRHAHPMVRVKETAVDDEVRVAEWMMGDDILLINSLLLSGFDNWVGAAEYVKSGHTARMCQLRFFSTHLFAFLFGKCDSVEDGSVDCSEDAGWTARGEQSGLEATRKELNETDTPQTNRRSMRMESAQIGLDASLQKMIEAKPDHDESLLVPSSRPSPAVPSTPINTPQPPTSPHTLIPPYSTAIHPMEHSWLEAADFNFINTSFDDVDIWTQPERLWSVVESGRRFARRLQKRKEEKREQMRAREDGFRRRRQAEQAKRDEAQMGDETDTSTSLSDPFSTSSSPDTESSHTPIMKIKRRATKAAKERKKTSHSRHSPRRTPTDRRAILPSFPSDHPPLVFTRLVPPRRMFSTTNTFLSPSCHSLKQGLQTNQKFTTIAVSDNISISQSLPCDASATPQTIPTHSESSVASADTVHVFVFVVSVSRVADTAAVALPSPFALSEWGCVHTGPTIDLCELYRSQQLHLGWIGGMEQSSV
ncbi:hypothetical protein BLNAU_14054 [Blattamonas nauphoetae]|uniref:ZZ-type domain-containing protein n=1 Tax=Blattamonas nauphoetae TaxID=2049346 RepID=A0ABQ9XES4_9EUKA|nr:hypothetical protein BLNAU_14054 [Blattamonas nauphoetae]